MKEYLTLRAAAHDVLEAVSEHDLERLREMLEAVSRTVRRSIHRRGARPLEVGITKHPLVVLVRARIADITGTPMSWPVSYTEVREAVCKIAYPSWNPPQPGMLFHLFKSNAPSPVLQPLRLVTDDEKESHPSFTPTDGDDVC